jgi:hypothetical protein
MGYKWKPNAAQKRAYIESLEAKKQVETHTTPHAIRSGCFVEYFNVAKGVIVKGNVTNHSYGAKTNQHTFTIDGVLVKGRNLYPNVVRHTQGEESKLVSIN